jgi:hypothetical protein
MNPSALPGPVLEYRALRGIEPMAGELDIVAIPSTRQDYPT